MRAFVTLSIVLGLCVGQTGFASAASVRTTVRLSEATLAHGYTIAAPDDGMLLGIPPGVFGHSATAKVQVVERVPGDETAPVLSERTSDAYVYDVSQPTPHVLQRRVVWLAIRAIDATGIIHFYDRATAQWYPLPTSYNAARGYAQAPSPFAYAMVALFTPTGPAPSNITAPSAYVMDPTTGQVYFAKDADTQRSIASITKLMTALVFLDAHIPMERIVAMHASDETYGGQLRVSAGETLSVRDLFFSTLTASANNAANALARVVDLDRASFVRRMNERAAAMGLRRTHFVDPSGLDAGNVSTAREVTILLNEALKSLVVLQATTVPTYDFTMRNTGIPHHLRTTNELRFSSVYLLGGKTGYTDEAGYCLVVRARRDGVQRTAVVLGSSTASGRFTEVEHLLNWALRH